MAIRLGDDAPGFKAQTTQGEIDFLDWKGKGWAVLFSHPKDFTPVCTTELGAVAALKPEFEKRNTKVIGLSVDPLESHKKWEGDIKDVTGHQVNFPMIADADRKVSDLYGMIHPNASDTFTVRSVFIIGPDNKVKLTLTYPASTGRNFDGDPARHRFASAHGRLLRRDACGLEGWRRRHRGAGGQRRGCARKVPERVRCQEAVSARNAAAEQVTTCRSPSSSAPCASSWPTHYPASRRKCASRRSHRETDGRRGIFPRMHGPQLHCCCSIREPMGPPCR